MTVRQAIDEYGTTAARKSCDGRVKTIDTVEGTQIPQT